MKTHPRKSRYFAVILVGLLTLPFTLLIAPFLALWLLGRWWLGILRDNRFVFKGWLPVLLLGATLFLSSCSLAPLEGPAPPADEAAAPEKPHALVLDTSKKEMWVAFMRERDWVQIPDEIVPSEWNDAQIRTCVAFLMTPPNSVPPQHSRVTGVFMNRKRGGVFQLACHSAAPVSKIVAARICKVYGLVLRGQEGTLVECWPEEAKGA